MWGLRDRTGCRGGRQARRGLAACLHGSLWLGTEKEGVFISMHFPFPSFTHP